MNEDNTLDTTVDEWRAEMECMTPNDPGKTARELAREFGSPISTMRDRLNKLIESGRCIKGVGRRMCAHGAHGAYTVSVYQLKKASKK